MNCEEFDQLSTKEPLDDAARKDCEAHERECEECRGTLAAIAAYDDALAHPEKFPKPSPEKIQAEVAAIFAKAKKKHPRTSPWNVVVLSGALAASFAVGLLLAPRVAPEPTLGAGSWFLKAAEAELALGEKDRAREHLKAVATDPMASPLEKETAATLLEHTK